DRIVELLPQEKFPYEFFTLGIIDGYYMANETEKASNLLASYADITLENLKYLFSLEPKFTNILGYDIELNLQVMQQLVATTERYSQTDLKEKYEPEFNMYITQYYQRGR
ncbi:MAG: hypothetical protein PHD00_10015, partial [Bacteroidales bacterium]|nr:hypothetical protein [Bacteroidales bacterium]